MQGLFLAAAILVAPLFIGWKVVSVVNRRRRLTEKYQTAEVVRKVLKKQLWVGQTTEQLVDALGRPSDIDQKVSKTKSKETWRYERRGKHRFGLRITIEDGVVVGWDEKSRSQS
jgi:hypothetical protein